MAYASITDIRTGNSVGEKIAAFVAAKREALAKYRMYRRTVDELSALNTNELSDLGLSRGSIHSTAYEAVYGA